MEEMKEMLGKIVEKNSTISGKWLNKCQSCGVEYEITDSDFTYSCPKCVFKRRAERLIVENIPIKYQKIETDKKELITENLSNSLFVTGQAGTGKTVFSCSFLKETYRAGRFGKFIVYPTFIMQLQNMFRNENEDPFNFAKSIALYGDLVVLDDLGAEKLTDYVRQITYYILNEREQRCLQTVITSNFSLAQIDEQIDSRVSSRIAGMCKVLKFGGKDRRINK